MLDLLLLGASVADDRGLDGERGVFGDFEAGSGGGKHSHAPDLAQLQSGLHVKGIEHIFDGYAVGVMLGAIHRSFKEGTKDFAFKAVGVLFIVGALLLRGAALNGPARGVAFNADFTLRA